MKIPLIVVAILLLFAQLAQSGEPTKAAEAATMQLGLLSDAGAASSTEAQPQAGTASESPEDQARRNKELAVRPFLFAACLTIGAVIGMLLVSRWRKRKRDRKQ